jgi:hypothetical protein
MRDLHAHFGSLCWLDRLLHKRAEKSIEAGYR